MAVIITYQLDPVKRSELIAGGYTTLRLYYANSPDGTFANSSATVTPSTISGATTEPYTYSLSYASGNYAQFFKVVAYGAGPGETPLNEAETFHGGGGTTLQRLRQSTGKFMRNMWVGTTTSNGTTGTAICTNANFTRYPNDYFGGGSTGEIGNYFHRLDTSPTQWTQVSDWVQGTGTFSFSPVFGTAVNSATAFEVLSRWTPDEFKDAINWSIVNSYPTLSKTIVNQSIMTAQDTDGYTMHRYQVPGSILGVTKVEIESHAVQSGTLAVRGHPWRELPFREYTEGLTRFIEFKAEPPFSETNGGFRLRVSGTGMLSLLNLDTDYVEVIEPQTEIICYGAAYRLYSMLPNDSVSYDYTRIGERAGYYAMLWEDAKKKFGTRRQTKRMWGHDAQWNRR